MRLLFLIVLILSTVLYAAPATQPQADARLGAAQALAKAVCDGDVPAAERIVGMGAIRAFGSKDASAIHDLCEHLNGATLVVARAYASTPTELAGDLSDDFETSPVPKAIKERMVLAEGAPVARANTTAAIWVRQMLNPSAGQAIGVLVLYQPSSNDPTNGEILFVLIKFQPTAPLIAQIVYGSPSAGL